MERTIRLNFDVSFVYGPRTWRAPLLAAMMLAGVGELSSENVTLSTYYPAPSGVYTNMITTGNTFLARDGAAASRVGIGTTSPGAKLHVVGDVQSEHLKFPGVGGDSGVGNDYYGIYQESGAWAYPYPDLRIQYHTGIKYDAYFGYGGHRFYTGWDGGTGNPAGLKLQIDDAVRVSGYVKIDSVGCNPVDVVQGPVCNSSEYATFSPGLGVEGWSYQNRGGQVLAEAGAGITSNQVWAMNPATGNAAWMTLKKNDSQTRIYCCPR